MLTAPLLAVSVAVKLMFCEPVSVAVQFPLIALLLELFPQADSAAAMKSMIAMPKCFIKSLLEVIKNRRRGSCPRRSQLSLLKHQMHPEVPLGVRRGNKREG